MILANYYFFLDFEGNDADETVKRVLDGVKNNTVLYKFLGCYKEQYFGQFVIPPPSIPPKRGEAHTRGVLSIFPRLQGIKGVTHENCSNY
jgi:hypothetical protein